MKIVGLVTAALQQSFWLPAVHQVREPKRSTVLPPVLPTIPLFPSRPQVSLPTLAPSTSAARQQRVPCTSKRAD
jgi:hypothetical protein